MNTIKTSFRQLLSFCRRNSGMVLGCLLLAIVVLGDMFYHLGSLTAGLSHSEIITSNAAYGWHGLGHHPLDLPINLVRSIIFTLNGHHGVLLDRLPSTLFGISSIITLSLIALLWHGRKTALLVGLLFATNAWVLHTSRFAGNQVLYLWIVPKLILVYLLAQQQAQPVKRKRPLTRQQQLIQISLFYGSMFLTGLDLYVPGLVWLLIPLLYWQRRTIMFIWQTYKLWWQRALYVAAGAVWLPLLLVRLASVATLKTWLGLPQHLAGPITLIKNFLLVPVHLLVHGPFLADQWMGHAPLLDIFSLALVIAGAVFYIQHAHASRSRFLAGSLLVGWILVALNGPVGLSILLPLVYLLAATGITYLLHDWMRVFPLNPLARGLGNGLVILAVIVSCSYNLRAYFVAWPHTTTTEATFRYIP